MTDADPPSRRRSRSGPTLLETALAIAVLGVALAAILMSWRMGQAMDAMVAQNVAATRAATTPLLRMVTADRTPAGEGELSYALVNDGLGPARLEWFELRYQGRALASHWALIEKFGYRPSGGVTTAPVAGTMLRPGERRAFFRWAEPADGDPIKLSWNKLDEIRGTLEAEACYCSIAGECWVSLLNEVPPRKVAACDPSGRVSIAG